MVLSVQNVSLHLRTALGLKDTPSSSLFPTTLGKSHKLGIHAITRIDGANLLK